jgi:GDP-L-fucose synthase
MKTVLVTGSSGLLGSAVVREYKKDNTKVISHTRKECDLNSYDDTLLYIEKMKNEEGVDTVIHCAAEVGGVLKNTLYSQNMFENNLLINDNIIKSCHINGIPNFINILSTCVFAMDTNYPLSSETLTNGLPHPSTFGYALAKRLSMQLVQSYKRVYNKNWINVVPTNIYGINDNFNLSNSHVIPALISKAYDIAKTKEDFIIWGSGEALRQFIFSDDLARLIKYADEKWKSDDPFMAVNVKEYSIKEIAFMIADRFGISKERVKFDTSKPGGIPRMTADTNASYNFSFTSLEDGLDITIKWFTKNYKNIRR